MTTFEVTLDGMAHGGDAVGRYQGKAVFVPLAIPGETVRVEVLDERSRFLRARLLEVSEPAPERVVPPCPFFGRCGGCNWQHIAYDAQLRFKRQIVRSLLQRTGKQPQPVVRSPIGMAEPWRYRNRVQLRPDHKGRIGYYALRSNDVVPVDTCLLAHPLLDELWGALDIDVPELDRLSLRAGVATGDQMLLLEGRGDPPELQVDVPVSCLWRDATGQVTVLAGDSCLYESLAGHLYRVSGSSFFQVNTLQAERLIETLRRYLQLQPHETLLDAYCGVGTFALSLAKECQRVIGIESSSWAMADAVASAEMSDVAERLTFYEGDVVEVLSEVPVHCDALVVDPPRTGLAPQALDALARCGASRIAYVSCDPATLARDVARLAERGYCLIEVQPVDMFPQTYHIECLALLSRR